MRFKTYLAKFSKSDSKVYSLHLPIPESVAKEIIEKKSKRVRCELNSQETITTGLMPSKKYWFLLINQDLQKKLQIQIGDEVDVEMTPEVSKYGVEMPEELQATLDQDTLAAEFFDLLTPGKQRNLIYLVSKVKNSNSRINKALAIIDHLTEMQGKLDFKLLNEKIKEYNQRGKLK